MNKLYVYMSYYINLNYISNDRIIISNDAKSIPISNNAAYSISNNCFILSLSLKNTMITYHRSFIIVVGNFVRC